MWATSDGPRIEDFGINEGDLDRAPKLFLSNHRPGVLVGAYIIAAVVAFTAIFHSSGSMPAAVFFSAMTLAAGSVLLLPVLMLVLCAGEWAEERWFCRRVPILRACLAYQRAVAEHRRSTDNRVSPVTAPEAWSSVSHSAFLEMLSTDLDTLFEASVSRANREETGFDFVVERAERRLLLRCESGVKPVAAAVGRELVAAVDDFRGDAAVIITVAEPTPALDSYIADRPITIAPPWALDAVVSDVCLRISD
ncbi:MAG: hypothetical protein OQK55_07820 [Thermoanaerobaculales bacterium]|nr:hypothetical protein [Thermoanaerobaculales bacterium]